MGQDRAANLVGAGRIAQRCAYAIAAAKQGKQNVLGQKAAGPVRKTVVSWDMAASVSRRTIARNLRPGNPPLSQFALSSSRRAMTCA
jgi:hypothetical protein